MSKLSLCLVIGIALVVSTPQCVQAQSAQSCKVAITSPQKGDTVEVTGDISGTATVPSGMFLWILVHRKGLADWWPQSGGPAKPDSGGGWGVHATFGDESNPSKDAKSAFEIVAAVVDKKEHDEIAKYVKQTKDTGKYPGLEIDLPPSPGCDSETVIVMRR